MKKKFMLIFIASMSLCFSACGNKEKAAEAEESAAENEETKDSREESKKETPTETPSVAPTEAADEVPTEAPTEAPTKAPTNATAKASEEVSEDSSEGFDNSVAAEDIMSIDTEYGTLFYPAEWKKELVTSQNKTDDILTVSFSAKESGKEYELFTVTITAAEGDSVGTITDAEGTERSVFVETKELEVSALDEKVQNQLYTMQECINVVIENLK